MGRFTNIPLVDLILGVETGGSPFSPEPSIFKNASRSLWQGRENDPEADQYTRLVGAIRGSAIVGIGADVPGIYLPLGNCESVAKQLPVTWRDDIGYFVWNLSDVRYKRIVTSPAYLGFIFTDREAKNITIKVPFPLLNLILQEPIVSTPTPYFPCHPSNSDGGRWYLGRASLQSAFFASNYDQNVIYLAQGPGPDMDHSVIRQFPPNDSEIQTNPNSSFEKSWQSIWTPIPEMDVDSNNRQLSPGAIAGIVIGSIVAILLIVASVWVFLQKKKKRNSSQNVVSTAKNETVHEVSDTTVIKHEMHGQHLQELPGSN